MIERINMKINDSETEKHYKTLNLVSQCYMDRNKK